MAVVRGRVTGKLVGPTFSARLRGPVSRGPVSRGRIVLALAALAALLLPVSALAGRLPHAPASGYAEALNACPEAPPGYERCFALVRKPVARPAAGAQEPGVRPFVVGAGAATAGPAGGLTPEDLASAYDYSPAAGGSGETVAIVDAFDDPAIASDLAEFDSHYGLPPCTTGEGCLTKVGQSGGAPPSADTKGWSLEIALDVETVHAACPNCKILLVEANDNSGANLASATNEAVALGASVVSNSYGGPEDLAESFERSAYNHPGVPILASTGDDGYYDWLFFEPQFQMANAPASLPDVIAVGGTTLTLNPDGTRKSETVWSESGGGCSQLFGGQSWQQDTAGFGAAGCGGRRLDADVSAVGDPSTGLDVYDTYNCGTSCEKFDKGWVTVGGTSLSSPLVSSLYALAGGGHGLPYPSLTLYGHAARFDVTEGGNGACEGEAFECEGINSIGLGRIDCEGTRECDAAPGYDGPSGVGTPEGLGLFEPEPPTVALSAPGALTVGSPASFAATGFSDPYPGASIASASWSWGDGSSSNGLTASHVYAAPGSYTVTLTAADGYGAHSAPVSSIVSVAPAAPGGSEPGPGSGSGSGGAGVGSTGSGAGSAAQGVAGLLVSNAAHSPSARLSSSSLKVSAGKVKLAIACTASGAACSGTVTLTASAAHASGAKSKPLVLGSGSFTIAAGKSGTVTIRLSAKARALLAKGHRLNALATIVLHPAGGAAHTTSSAVTLRPAGAAHHAH
ncbi:MAG TPA: PKD domain-containing protein [Solirubrobacteraceae bacterium]|nr:PKD domain-containing protein [Solirubrobacteraceae bacterium]